jgi:DNA-binding CsgD family transcriptional regulator/tetratricopeptide (TPR) repeat protein
MQGDYAYARTRFEESLALWEELEDQHGIAFTLACLARQADMLGERALARSLAEASLDRYRKLGDSWGTAFALKLLGAVHKNMGDYAAARSLTEASLVRYRELGDAWGITDALSYSSEIAIHQRDYLVARAWLEEALGIGQRLGNKWFLKAVYRHLGNIARQQDNDEQAAVALFEQSLSLAREIGDRSGITYACVRLGLISQRRGDDQQAMRYFRESLEHIALIPGQGVILALAGCAALATGHQQWDRADRLYGSAEALRAKLVHPLDPGEQADYDHTVAMRARRQEPRIAAAWQQGQVLTLEEAVAYALTWPDAPSTAEPSSVLPPPPAYPAGLTTREVEVLRLLAQGLTYAEIAAKLIITRRTVNGHTTSIYSKLGVNRRAAATRFALAHHLV